MRKEWWNTPMTAWAFTAIGIGAGVVLTYISPYIGIPIGAVIFLIGIYLLFRTYRKKDGQQDAPHNDPEGERPRLTFGDKSEINVQLDEKRSLGVSILTLYYHNTGSKPAYQSRMQLGYAPEGEPNRFKLFSENTSANPIYPGDPQQGIMHTFAYKYEVKDGKKITRAPKGVLIHCSLSYSDAPSEGSSYDEEWWYSYRFDKQQFSSLSIPRMKQLEPFVRLAYQQRAISE